MRLLDIPTLEHGVPKGKSGKDHRILTNEIRESKPVLLQMLEEANELSTESSDNSEIERKRVDKHRKDRKIRRSLKSIKSKLAEECQHREEKPEGKKRRKRRIENTNGNDMRQLMRKGNFMIPPQVVLKAVPSHVPAVQMKPSWRMKSLWSDWPEKVRKNMGKNCVVVSQKSQDPLTLRENVNGLVPC